MPITLRYGLIGSLLLILIALTFQLTGLSNPATGEGNTLSMVISITVMAGAIFLGIRQHKDADLNGYISFGRAFGVGFFIGLIMCVVSGIYSYLYFTVIDPGVMDIIYSNAEGQMAERGMTDTEIEQAMQSAAFFMTPGFMSVAATIFNLIITTVLSLIMAAVLQRKQ